MKVAFDEHVPPAVVEAFQLFANQGRFKASAKGVTFSSSVNYNPDPNDPDYRKGQDDPWIRRFAKSGGKVIVTADKAMKSASHERKALLDEGFIVIFLGKEWAGWKFTRKCAFLLNWSLPIIEVATTAAPGTF